MLQYLIKFSISLAVLFIFYRAVLRPLTFYQCNRFYLLCYSLLSFVIPFINITPWVAGSGNHELINAIPAITYYNIGAETQVVASQPNFLQRLTVTDWVLLIFCTGALIVLVRLIAQYLSLRGIRRKAVLLDIEGGVQLYETNARISPFSFGNAIYFNRRLHTEEELQRIIQHEFVHVKQKHTIDLLTGELLCIVNWFNPFAWLIRNSIRQNLEFIADNNVVANGLDKKEYQYLLLKVVGMPQYSIANNFNFSHLKKRIAMMNKMKSAKLHLTKFLFVLPLLVVVLLAFRNKINDKTDHQSYVFTGIVYDEKTSQPLPNVAINEKNSGLSVTTDNNGFFKLKIPLPKDSMLNLSYDLNLAGFGKSANRFMSMNTARSSHYANLVFVGLDKRTTNGHSEIVFSSDYHQMPVDEKNQFVPDPDYAFVLNRFNERQSQKAIEARITVLAKDSKSPIWIIDGIPYAIGSSPAGGSMRAWFDKEELASSPGFKVWVDGKIMSMNEANATVSRYELNSVNASGAENSWKEYGVNENLFVLKRAALGSLKNNDTLTPPPPPIPAIAPVALRRETPEANKKGYIITVADNNGECIVLIKDKKQKIVKALALTEWNDNKTEYTNRYGELPPPPPAPPVKISVNALQLSDAPAPPVKGTRWFYVKGGGELRIIDALFIIDGVEQPKGFDPNTLKPETIKEINVLKGQSALAVYGEKGANGVLMITTKKPGDVVSNKTQSVNFGVKQNGPQKVESLHLFKEKSAFDKYADKEKLGSVDIILKDKGSLEGPQALIIVDGVELPAYANVNDIDPQSIESVSIIKGAGAIATYGERGKQGVIQIETKNFSKDALLIIDGKEFPAGTKWMGYVNWQNNTGMESMKVLNPKDATEKYGDKGKKGVIEIQTKKATPVVPISQIPSSSNAVLARNDGKAENTDPGKTINGPTNQGEIRGQASMIILKRQHIIIKGGSISMKGEDYQFEGELSFQPGFDQLPMLIYNGKEVANVHSFKVANTKFSLVSLDEKQAVLKYGAKAKNGAVEINRL